MVGEDKRRYKDHLARQLRFIERSCQAYDEGYTDEAVRIATQIRVIVHPGGKSRRSLLQHLATARIPLLTTSGDAPERDDLIEFIGLGSFGFASDGGQASGGYGPGLDRAIYRDLISADRWWQQAVMFLEGTRYSRRDIALGSSQQEGGTHVADRLTPEFEELMAPGALGDFVLTSGGEETRKPITDVHHVCVRQMGYELLNSPALRELAGY
jgi:hypothetical protein